MAGLRLLRFDDCVIDPQRRTVQRAGRVGSPQPKVFDLIMCLARRRGRVVTKRELLDEVWGRRVVVTDGVVARTVMKARRAIGDDTDQPRFIKTLHRVGYCFVAEITEEPWGRYEAPQDDKPGLATPMAAPGTSGRIAVLPFRDSTGAAELAWVKYGLMVSTIGGLARIEGIHVLPAADVLMVLGSADAQLPLHMLSEKVAQGLGATDGLCAELLCEPTGGLSLRYQGWGPRLASLAGRVVSKEPLELSHALVHEICAVVGEAPTVAACLREDASAADQHYAEATYRRAMHALKSEHWEMARRLLRIVLDVQCDNQQVRLEYARCLVWQHDPAAGEWLRQLLDEARAQGDDASLRAHVQYLRAQHARSEGDYREAEQLLTEALSIAELRRDLDMELQMLVSLSDLLVADARPAVAAWMIERASSMAVTIGSQRALAHLHDVRGRLAVAGGDEAGGIAAFSAAVSSSEQLGLRSSSVFSLVHLGYCWLGKGVIDAARESFARAVSHAQGCGSPLAAGVAVYYAVRYSCFAAGQGGMALDMVRQLQRGRYGRHELASGCAALAESFVAVREGRHDAALLLLEQARKGLAMHRRLGLEVERQIMRLHLYLGRVRQVEILCEEMIKTPAKRLSSMALGTALHGRSMVAMADRRIDEARTHLRQAIAILPRTIYRNDAVLDLAWLELDAGQADAAQQTLGEIADFNEAALRCGYAAATQLQTRLRREAGHSVPPARLHAAARRGVLPSLSDLHPVA